MMLPFRVGQGFDVHAFREGRRLVLGGVVIPHDRGLEGHSDADVLAHAVTDALLGALALGDLGTHFPPTDDRWKDADSLELLRQAVRLAAGAGGRPAQLDATLFLEEPRVAPHVPTMRANLAEALGVDVDRVSVKATTTEGLGFVGRADGAAASAVLLVALDGEAR
jgi:2-C-methyl-D-erythritol 2,4-cyclodiphosphate synthase